jgi:hypothetical protein
MVLKAPSEPSGSQELQSRRAAPGPHGTHPPSHSACGCQPSFRFSAAGLFHITAQYPEELVKKGNLSCLIDC